MGAKASTEQRPRTFSGSDPSTSSGGGGAATTAAVSSNGASSSGAGSSSGGHHHHHHHHHHSFRSGNGGNSGGGGGGPAGSSSSSALLQGPSTSAVRARSYSSSAVHNSQGAAGIIELGSRINSFASGLWPISVKSKVVDSSPLNTASNAFNTDAVYPESWSFNNNNTTNSTNNNNTSPSAPPASASSRESTWAIAYAENNNAQPTYGVKCPICNKSILPDDIEVHLVMCLTRPRLNYNEDILEESKGDECAICLEELEAGQVIARLPCLCIYHQICISAWFERSRSCPEHPNN